jgi:hypothetical protein
MSEKYNQLDQIIRRETESEGERGEGSEKSMREEEKG